MTEHDVVKLEIIKDHLIKLENTIEITNDKYLKAELLKAKSITLLALSNVK